MIFATGYRPGYDGFLPAELSPGKSGVNASASDLGLYLVGFYNPVTGLLREIGIEAKAVAMTGPRVPSLPTCRRMQPPCRRRA